MTWLTRLELSLQTDQWGRNLTWIGKEDNWVLDQTLPLTILSCWQDSRALHFCFSKQENDLKSLPALTNILKSAFPYLTVSQRNEYHVRGGDSVSPSTSHANRTFWHIVYYNFTCCNHLFWQKSENHKAFNLDQMTAILTVNKPTN